MMQKKLRPRAIVPKELYVERAADRQLRAIIEDMGRPGYVLVARQMGKTNLLIHMKNERTDDIVLYQDLSVRFDNSRLWFRNVIDTLVENFGGLFPKACEVIARQRDESQLAPNVEYDRHLRQILREVTCRVIIVLDEVDSLINTSYSDAILSQIRSMYFSRSNYQEYEKLTYVLSGVVEPTDLIKDKNISPFNIGEKIYLENFNFSELLSFIGKAQLQFDESIAARIFDWTSGNPRITWEVCAELETMMRNAGFVTVDDVEIAVQKVYLNEFDRAPVDHIRTLVRSDNKIQDAIVSIRYGKSEFLDQDIKNKLYLAGITNSAGSSVSISNKIVDAALSEKWLNSPTSVDPSFFGPAKAYYAEGNYHAAVETFESLLTASNDENFSVQDRKSLALAYLYTGKFSDAARELRLCLAEQSDPNVTQFLYLELGIALVGEAEIAEAQKILQLATGGPDQDIAFRSQLEIVSISLTIGDSSIRLKALETCEKTIAGLSAKNVDEDEFSRSNLVLAKYLKSMLLKALRREKEAAASLEDAIQLSMAKFRPAILLEKAWRSNKRTVRVSLAREIVSVIIDNGLAISITDDGRLQLSETRFAEILLLLVQERLIKEFKELVEYYALSNFAGEISPFAALKHLYAEFDDAPQQEEYVEILVWSIRYFGDLAKDWREKIEVYREIVMVYQGNEKNDLRVSYLAEFSLHLSEVEKFADIRHIEALSVIGLAVIQGADWRLGRRVFDIWEVVRKTLDTANVFSLLLDYIELLGVKAGQIFGVDAAGLASRILKSIRDNDVAFRKSSQSDLIALVKREAELAAKNIPEPKMSQEAFFRSLKRNDWVTVTYFGLQPFEKKFKYVEDDLREGKCTLVSVRRNY